MRDGLYQAICQTNSAHAGLLMQRGLRQWEDGDKPYKQKLIKTITSIKADSLYLLAFNRWLQATHDKPTFATIPAKIDGRLFTGLALGGTLETGAMTHHTYGMPIIAGSSIKGAVRHYAEHLFAQRDDKQNIQYQDNQLVIQENKKPILHVLFGKDGDDDNDAGYLIWHDAWWIPKVDGKMQLSTSDENKPFVDEVVTVHHSKYYNRSCDKALDMENPIPNQQIAIAGDFYFCIEGDADWLPLAKQLLEKTLNEQGLGAKGSNGYGYFVNHSEAFKPFLQHQQQIQALAQQVQEQQKIEQQTAHLTDNQKLVYRFVLELDKKPVSKWHNKPNVDLNIDIDDEKLNFNILFNKVETWEPKDQKYAMEQVFLKHRKHLSKNLQDKVKALKQRLGI